MEKQLIIGHHRYDFIHVPPGSFMMGSPNDEPGRESDEGLHTVTLTKGFFLGECAVYQGFWEAFMGTNPSLHKKRFLPVHGISFNDCKTFIETLNKTIPEANVRLPTEAEWEYACRAGTNTAFNIPDTSPILFNTDSPLAVGDGVRNDWGFYHMHGNVYEWCEDTYLRDITSLTQDPLVTHGDNSNHILRGGCWKDHKDYCRSAHRVAGFPNEKNITFGIRLAADIFPTLTGTKKCIKCGTYNEYIDPIPGYTCYSCRVKWE